MEKKRVVITGMGVITPIGTTVETFYLNSLKGNSGVKKVKSFTIPDHASQIAGIVEDFDPTDRGISMEEADQLDRSCQFALVAARDALNQAGLLKEDKLQANPSRCAVYVATAIAGITSMERQFLIRNGEKDLGWANEVSNNVKPHHAFSFNTLSRTLSEKFGFQGGHCVLATGCTGGVDSMGFAMQAILSGQADVVMSGASEAPITPLVVASFARIQATSTRNHDPEGASRPFDVERDGFVLAEGSGMLVLESLEHALDRGATILAEVFGYGSCNNAEHMTNIPQDGASIASSIRLAFQDAKVGPDDIDFINLHGSSTPQNDVAESEALALIFQDRGSQIPVTSTKSLIGHPLGASNSIELVSTVLAIQSGQIHPTRNLQKQDPLCRLNVVTGRPISAAINKVLKVSSGFSGIHSSLVLGKYTG